MTVIFADEKNEQTFMYNHIKICYDIIDLRKYNVADNTWTLHGSMLEPKEEHVVYSVTGIKCG
jgi:hypothetical protein